MSSTDDQPAAEGAESQDEVIAVLRDGRAFGLPGEPVERIDTHAAIIFLIGDCAYKLKRAVAYSFLDFSTAEKRRDILKEEHRLNSRTAPELYRRVLPITREESGALALEGEGRAVDWLLEMTRFEQSALLDHLAEEGRIDPPLIDALAAEIAELHGKAEVRHPGGHAAIAEIVDGNARDLAGLESEIGQAARVRTLMEATRAELARQHALLDQRAEAGFVRHCHGDLHLGNIYLDGDRPVLFDCLEFDPKLATTDVFYDLAFLLMDLCHRGLDGLAVDLLNGYLERTEDDAGTALLPLFLAIRATIRAKIEGLEIRTSGSEEDAEKHRRAALQYLDLATDLLAVEPAYLIAIGGLSGSGKSTVACRLAEKLGRRHWALVLRSDVLRKRLHGLDPKTRLSEAAYGADRSAEVYKHLGMRASTLLQAGRSVIADATFIDTEKRAALEQLASERGVPFHGIWLDAPRDVLERRISARRGDASDADLEVLARQYGHNHGAITWTRQNADAEIDTIAAAIQRDLGTS